MLSAMLPTLPLSPRALAARLLLALGLAASAPAGSPAADHPVDRYDVVWTTPSADSSESMPLGNGDLALNAWTEPSGDLLFYPSHSGAWTEFNRQVKLGRVRVAVSPPPLRDGAALTQHLRLRDGTYSVTFAGPAHRVTLRLRPDAHHPVVHIEAEADHPVTLTASLDPWRAKPRTLAGAYADSALGTSGQRLESADIVASAPDALLWYHRNETSWFPTNRAKNHLNDFAPLRDPLLHRTFGGHLSGENFAPADERTLRSASPATTHALRLVAHVAQTATADAWINDISVLASRIAALDTAAARAAHEAWWSAFWERSFLRLTTPAEDPLPPRIVQPNDQPLRLGGALEGDAIYGGGIARVRLSRGLDPDASDALVGDWDFSSAAKIKTSSARLVGSYTPTDDARGLQLGPDTRLEIPGLPRDVFRDAFTLELWLRLAEGDAGGRLLDKTTPGESDVLQLDIPGHDRVARFRTTKPHFSLGRLPVGEWTRVVLQYDASARRVSGRVGDGTERVVVHPAPIPYTPDLLAQQWHLQRFVTAAAGRGAHPIKFNGSQFTFDIPGQNLDADYRRWGGGYWFQNQRLIYWPLLASGDHDLLQPFFTQFRENLPVAAERARQQGVEGGAIFPETMTFWGTLNDSDVGARPGEIRNPWIRHYHSGNLELLALALDYYEHSHDEGFLRDTLLPLARPIIVYYQKHATTRTPEGRARFAPGQALETFQNANDPANEIAGLLHVLPRLAALPTGLVTAEERAAWLAFRDLLPPLPRTTAPDGTPVLAAAAEILSTPRNSENPELYAVFPFRLLGLHSSPADLALARDTFARRVNVVAMGWQQSDTQAARLGLADQAARLVLYRNRLLTYRFPAFWGPNNDWVPDQCHGGNLMNALQLMALQETPDGKIHVLPAWPADWDIHFRLHATHRTVVEARYERGRLVDVKVTPESARSRLVPHL
jgi:hypothetical protein